jgi:hypothetical protein
MCLILDKGWKTATKLLRQQLNKTAKKRGVFYKRFIIVKGHNGTFYLSSPYTSHFVKGAGWIVSNRTEKEPGKDKSDEKNQGHTNCIFVNRGIHTYIKNKRMTPFHLEYHWQVKDKDVTISVVVPVNGYAQDLVGTEACNPDYPIIHHAVFTQVEIEEKTYQKIMYAISPFENDHEGMKIYSRKIDNKIHWYSNKQKGAKYV